MYEIATYLSNDMYLPALPEMIHDLSLSTREAQWTLTTWFIGTASLPLIMGVISDRYGRRPVLLSGGVVYILSTLLCAFATNASNLLIMRFVEGAAIPSMMVAGYACIHELYDRNEAIRILALMSAITVLAPALGPLFGSFILLASGWRGIFWVIAVLSVISVVSLYYWMPETLPAEKREPVHFISIFKQYGRVLTNKHFMLLVFVIGFIFTGFIVWISAGPLLVIQTFHFSPMAFGWIQAFIFAAFILANFLVKHLLEKIGVQRLIWLGIVITLCGGILLGVFAFFLPDALSLFIIAMTIYSFGAAFCFPPLNRCIIEASDEPMGVRVALFTVLWTSFAVLGSLIASIYFDGSIPSTAYPITLSIVLSCLLMMVAARK
jgi:DHA1 family multidrug/chloramphenicol efflux transport protein-like MFS transporter